MSSYAGSVPSLDRQSLREVLGAYATGVAVVTAATPQGGWCGMTINSFSSVSLSPPLVLWCLRKESSALQVFDRARAYAISILAEDQRDIAMHFARGDGDKFAAIDHRVGAGGAPIIAGAAAHLECAPYGRHDAGDHVVFIWSVTDAARREECLPLVFHGGKFQTLRRSRPVGSNAAHP